MATSMNKQKRRFKMISEKNSVWLLIIGVIFIAATLRAPLTAVGPIVGLIKEDLAISNTLAGFITTLPLLAFALFSPIVPKLARRLSMEKVIFYSMLFLAAGIAIRSYSSIGTLYIGTAIVGLSISVSNVLVPGLIKRNFPLKVGLMIGIYSISMNIFGAIATGVSVPIAMGAGLGWEWSLGIWMILAIISVLVWLPQLKNGQKNKNEDKQQQTGEKVNLWKSKLAWKVTLFMGLQSMVFYVLVAWLPEIFKYQGLPASESGFLLSILLLFSFPFTFIVPVVADKGSNQRLLVILISGILFAASLGILFGITSLNILWTILFGIGVGSTFGLAMIFFSLRTSNAQEAAELSGMAQSVGYLLAAIGPTLFGYLFDVTNNWMMPLIILVVVTLLILFFGLGAARDERVK